MNKLEQNMVAAVNGGYNWKSGNTEVRAQFENVAEYFDFEKYAEDLECDYTWEDGYVFRN